MKDEYKKEILAALKSQEKRQSPVLDHLISDVYQTPPAHLREQYSELLAHIDKYPDHYLPNPTKGQDSYHKPAAQFS
jgi:2-oxoisovalerate dehydrogenase E1 component alpha subunit